MNILLSRPMLDVIDRCNREMKEQLWLAVLDRGDDCINCDHVRIVEDFEPVGDERRGVPRQSWRCKFESSGDVSDCPGVIRMMEVMDE